MVEVSWKAILKMHYSDPNEYQAFMGILQTVIGVVSLFIALFVGGNFIRRYGWHASAQLTPVVLGLTSLLFFGVYLSMDDLHNTSNTLFGVNPLVLLVVVGAVHNVACKAMKYCLFDPTKEMAYIPLTQEAKIKGKAAVDLVGARFGKSGASWTQIALIDFFGGGSVLGIAPMLVPCLIVVVAFWIVAVKGLNKKFTRLQYQAV
jgi:AAA family ATP:ADP antiporter